MIFRMNGPVEATFVGWSAKCFRYADPHGGRLLSPRAGRHDALPKIGVIETARQNHSAVAPEIRTISAHFSLSVLKELSEFIARNIAYRRSHGLKPLLHVRTG